PIYRVSVGRLDSGEAVISLRSRYVPQDHGNAMRAAALRDTRPHPDGAYHSGVYHFLRGRFRLSFPVSHRKKEIADQIFSRFGFAKIDNRVKLKDERLLS